MGKHEKKKDPIDWRDVVISTISGVISGVVSGIIVQLISK